MQDFKFDFRNTPHAKPRRVILQFRSLREAERAAEGFTNEAGGYAVCVGPVGKRVAHA